MLGKLLSEKWAIAKRQDWGIVRAGYGAKRAAYGLKKNSDSTSSLIKLWNSNILLKWAQI